MTHTGDKHGQVLISLNGKLELGQTVEVVK